MAVVVTVGPMLLKVGCCQKHSWPSPAEGPWLMRNDWIWRESLNCFSNIAFCAAYNPPQNRDSSHCTGEYCLAWTGWGQAWTKPRREASPLQLSSPPKPNLQFSNCNVFCLSGCHSSHTGITGWRPNFTMVTLLITTQ